MLPAWPPVGPGAVGGEGMCQARWPSGLHVRDKGPAPGRGRGAPGWGEEAPTLLRRPQPSSRGIATYTSRCYLCGALREVRSLLGRGSVISILYNSLL